MRTNQTKMLGLAGSDPLAPPLKCTDDDVHNHPLNGDEVDSTLRSAVLLACDTRYNQCRLLLDAFCALNNISYLVCIDNGLVEKKVYAPSSGSSSVHPYGLLYVSSEQRTTRSELFSQLLPEFNVHIVVSECRLYPSLVETITRAYPRIRYWDAVNSTVLNPRVVAAWQSLTHLNTLKLSLLNCMEPTVCRAQLTHWPTNHIQRLLILGGVNHDRDTVFHDTIVSRFPYLVHFANTALYVPIGTSDGSRVHITSPAYTVHPKPWMRRTGGSRDSVAYDDEAVDTVLRAQFQSMQVQLIGTQTLVAEVCV